jgi:hypothetical protein
VITIAAERIGRLPSTRPVATIDSAEREPGPAPGQDAHAAVAHCPASTSARTCRRSLRQTRVLSDDEDAHAEDAVPHAQRKCFGTSSWNRRSSRGRGRRRAAFDADASGDSAFHPRVSRRNSCIVPCNRSRVARDATIDEIVAAAESALRAGGCGKRP